MNPHSKRLSWLTMIQILLDDNEIEIVEEAYRLANKDFDPGKRLYSMDELESLGFVRESYSVEELHQRNFYSSAITTSFDEAAKRAEDELRVGAPFAKGNGVRKWQLPLDVVGMRVIKTVFPPGTVVLPHVHTVLDQSIRSGGLRMVVRGSIIFEGTKYLPGDWFFVPNGVPYSFITDPEEITVENYIYEHKKPNGTLRISRPKSLEA